MTGLLHNIESRNINSRGIENVISTGDSENLLSGQYVMSNVDTSTYAVLMVRYIDGTLHQWCTTSIVRYIDERYIKKYDTSLYETSKIRYIDGS